MDSGFYNREIITCLLSKGVEFSVSGKLATALNRAIEAVTRDQWKFYPWDKDAHSCEFPYHPKDWPVTFRMIVKRIPHYVHSPLPVDLGSCVVRLHNPFMHLCTVTYCELLTYPNPNPAFQYSVLICRYSS
jgi:hypothetical protein